MITLNRVSYESMTQEILRNVSFSINSGAKIGLVGPNGVGKTTLLRLINGDLKPTSGEIIRTDDEIGILPQDLRRWLDYSVYQFIEEVTGVRSVRERFNDICANLEHDLSEHAARMYADVLAQYSKFEVASFDVNLKKTLKNVDMAQVDTSKRLGNLSGGQQTRIALAAIFASHYDVVLLDEPTNNLDEKGVVILEKFIAKSDAAFLVVSHDRRFLRNATNQIIELDKNKRVSRYSLGYDEYIKARNKARRAASSLYECYEKESRRLTDAIKTAKIKANSASSNRSLTDNDKLTARFRKEKAASGFSGAARSMDSRLSKIKKPEQPVGDVALKFSFKDRLNKRVNLLSISDFKIDYRNGHKTRPVSFRIRSGDKLLLRGGNGSGKTSLIRAIVGDIRNSSGEKYISKNINIIYINQDQTLPLPDKPALDNVRSLAPMLTIHDAINLLLRFNIGKNVLRVTEGSKLSGGERAKVLLAGIAANSASLLVLDEPTNNLDIPTIEALEIALRNYRGGILLVSHDRDFIQAIGITKIVDVSCKGDINYQ